MHQHVPAGTTKSSALSHEYPGASASHDCMPHKPSSDAPIIPCAASSCGTPSHSRAIAPVELLSLVSPSTSLELLSLLVVALVLDDPSSLPVVVSVPTGGAAVELDAESVSIAPASASVLDVRGSTHPPPSSSDTPSVRNIVSFMPAVVAPRARVDSPRGRFRRGALAKADIVACDEHRCRAARDVARG